MSIEAKLRGVRNYLEPAENLSPMFTTVVGTKDPMTLLTPDTKEEGSFSVRDQNQDIPNSIGNYLGDFKIENRGICGHNGYDFFLDLGDGEIPEILKDMSARVGRLLRVMDFGSGLGVALEELCANESVDADNSYGLTLPGRRVYDSISDRVIRCNVSSLKPLPTTFASFDILFSVYGATCYHPFRRSLSSDDKDRKDFAFGALQSIALVREGGVIFDHTSYMFQGEQTDTFNQLAERGIIEKVEHGGRAIKKAVTVIRHPSPQEIKEILRVTTGEYVLS